MLGDWIVGSINWEGRLTADDHPLHRLKRRGTERVPSGRKRDTVSDDNERPDVICGATEASCTCGLPPHSDGPHECLHPDCRGSWSYDDNGELQTVRLPLVAAGMDPFDLLIAGLASAGPIQVPRGPLIWPILNSEQGDDT